MNTATKKAHAVLVVALFALVAFSQWAHAEIYGSDASGSWFLVNTTNGAGALVCTLPTGSTEIEFDNSSGRGIVQDINGSFWHTEFNPNTCVAFGPALTNGWAFNGMEYVSGTLYGMGIQGSCGAAVLHTINPLTGTVAAIGPSLINFPITGMAWDPTSGTMYGTTGCANSAAPVLVTINLSTGQATVVGPTGVADLGSLEFDINGVLYAGGGQRDGGNLYTINTATGTATLIGPTGFAPVTGLAMAYPPVPTEVKSWGSIKVLYE